MTAVTKAVLTAIARKTGFPHATQQNRNTLMTMPVTRRAATGRCVRQKMQAMTVMATKIATWPCS